MHTHTPAKKNYTTPKLINFGTVRLLTQAGASGCNEQHGNCSGSKKPSDRRMKENTARIGAHPLGFGLYLFDYKPEYREECGRGRQFGVMADEVEKVIPEAVSRRPDGFRQVDYAMLGIEGSMH